jgi:hypothetical protein
MKGKMIFLSVTLLALVLVTAATGVGDGIKARIPVNREMTANSVSIPLHFVMNRGQVDENVLYYARVSGYILWITRKGLVFDSISGNRDLKTGFKGTSLRLDSLQPQNLRRDVSALIFQNSNPDIRIVPLGKTGHRVNYFRGKDPSQWRTDISTSKAVLYQNVYKQISLKVYGLETQVEYDWIVKPGGDWRDIVFKYVNIEGTKIDRKGNLKVKRAGGEFIHKKPAAYQRIRGKKRRVPAAFRKIGKNCYGFKVGRYNPNKPLFIDPVVLEYSTYLGGINEDWCRAVALNSFGDAYVVGVTLSPDFPTQYPYQGTLDGLYRDAFVTKLSNTGSTLSFSTFLGGSGPDYGVSIVVDEHRNTFVIGETMSTDYPVLNAYQSSHGGGDWDIFVTKLSPAGNTIAYSTYLGGSDNEYAGGIAVDDSGRAHLTGVTASTDFPLKYACQGSLRGDCDAFVTRLSPTGEYLSYSTYLGGSDSDYGIGIAVNGGGAAFVTGRTTSDTNFPITQFAYQSNHGGSSDAFVTRFNSEGDISYSTYLGGSDYELGRDIAVDSSGKAYVVGSTDSTDFPTQNPFQGPAGNFDIFVTKLNTKGTSLAYSTYLGGSGQDEGMGIALNSEGNAYITGYTDSTDYPLQYEFQSSDTFYDAVVTKLDTTGSSLSYSTYLGGSSIDCGWGIAVDGAGDAIVTGFTWGTDFPTENAYQSSSGGQIDGFITKLGFTIFLPSEITLNRTQLNFGVTTSGMTTPSQIIYINNSGEGTLNWSVSNNVSWLNCSPSSGTNAGAVTVSVDVTGHSAGTYTGEITVTDPNASNSPQKVSVTLNVYGSGQTSVPFGQFASPEDGSTVSSSIPVTGWVMDDIGVESVKIYRGNPGSFVYIGDTLFVEGARPDIEQAFPDYPMNYKAGWGYMMLTNFLPNEGNGTFKIHAIATDIEGNEITLGTKTIYCDNTNAVKPFGAIDTPTQGGTASGSSFISWGWVLTPQPNSIPTDGSTINVYVDSINLGHPAYNIYRSDIATLFPGYANSDGAIGYFSLDTTAYENGVHTIYWTAADSGGNADGIGSRYFTIQNSGSSRSGSKIAGHNKQKPIIKIEELSNLPFNHFEPIKIKTGYGRNIQSKIIQSDEENMFRIEIRELERIEIQLSNVKTGYMLAGNRIHPLPLGSTIDTSNDIFYWIPMPGFYGNYRLLFVLKDPNGDLSKMEILVSIAPKFGINN